MSTSVIYEKKKYWAKVLKEEAIWTNYLRSVDTEDIFNEWAWSESMFFIWLNISSLFIFGLEPYELEPLDPEFNIEVPSLAEWLQGIKVKIIPKTVGEAWKEFYWDYYKEEVPPEVDFDIFVDATILPEYLQYIYEQKYRKLRVGYSKYGECFVDPPVIRDFIRSTLYELIKRRIDLERIRKIFKIAVERGFMVEGIVESIYNRMVMHLQSIFESFILDYNLLNYSKLCSRGSEKTTIPITTWRGIVLDMEISKFDEINMGFILNVTPLNLGILMSRKSVFKPSPISPHKVGTCVPAHFIDWKVRRMVSRYRATGVGFGNYQRPEEAFDFHRSERADHYHAIRDFYRHIDNLVENILANKGIDRYHMNMYKRAVSMLIGHKKKRHKWGYAAFRSMSEEEFRDWWIDYWARQGLDINILSELYNMVIKWLKPLRGKLEELGKRLSQRRKQLAQALL